MFGTVTCPQPTLLIHYPKGDALAPLCEVLHPARGVLSCILCERMVRELLNEGRKLREHGCTTERLWPETTISIEFIWWLYLNAKKFKSGCLRKEIAPF